MLKKLFLGVFILLLLTTQNLSADSFTKSATIKPELIQKGSQKEWCPVCGMKLESFYKTSHTSKVNHTDKQYCSMRCLAVDMQEHKIDTNDVKVVDALSQKLIFAKDAHYVVGSDVKGTMSKVSKVAFSSKEAADDFNIEHGGEVVSFEKALKMASESLDSDIEMVQNKKEKQVYPMGKKIYDKNCKQNIDANNYVQLNELKADLADKKLCGTLSEEELQPLSLYIWEVKRFEANDKRVDTIQVTKDEKCPICGMFVYKYPKWAAQIFYEGKHHSFDGVKDMMKYYFQNKDGIKKILVTDYYSQKAIDASTAFYVLGSDVYGPMGKELIPFNSQKEAKAFNMDHKGFKVIEFKDITSSEIYKLDE
ncbi:conserved hypothetical protein [Sulfurimonas denitrificans DSM 1251]|uniref:NosL n=1 Tax=Sulfurimonas denitrificans (strain ATCC 33889 / DSM 1251) TaxID=326298 RepID=Q30QY6_SULDN|nr:nitrous oxide reductase accessory protein NosL [Sulfurimonas denitrificans]ABB44595.1 conserved hypothetical protein [Sulfurimonas denitrificans DSM 1251]MDD3441780.1 nitrous oxide reductase accessory protein NosL [Sulfurimonas denitrificans]